MLKHLTCAAGTEAVAPLLAQQAKQKVTELVRVGDAHLVWNSERICNDFLFNLFLISVVKGKYTEH